MKSDELIARLLDGSISPSEKTQLEQLMAASPELAAEMEELRQVEMLLEDRTQRHLSASQSFRHSVKQEVRASLPGLGREKTLAWTRKKSRWTLLAAFLLISIGGILYLSGEFSSSPNEDIAIKPPQPATAAPATPAAPQAAPPAEAKFELPDTGITQPQIQSTPPEVTVSTPAAVEEHSTQEAESRRDRDDSPALADTVQDEEVTTSVDAADNADGQHQDEIVAMVEIRSDLNEQIARSIEKHEQQLQAKEAAGDAIGTALTAQKLGALYRQGGKDAESETYYMAALEAARRAGLREVEAQCLGELGLLKSRAGDRNSAIEMLEECVSILQSLESAEAGRWQKELDALK